MLVGFCYHSRFPLGPRPSEKRCSSVPPLRCTLHVLVWILFAYREDTVYPMGNQIAGLTLPPLISVEDCLSDLSGVFRFEEELLGSRLFKVAKAKRVDDGSSQLVVVKVFPCPNGLELMSAYDTLIKAYCRPIANGHNLLSFNVPTSFPHSSSTYRFGTYSQTSATDRNLLLVRDFIDQSLVDRLCTRPFLCLEEKRWISFQLLHALSQLHRRSKPGLDVRSTDRPTGSEGSAGVLCHGDIKAENVLLTSWGWVQLSDPAPFKPCWLPADNPSEFTHYFDSSRRRVCYLAPERFVELKNVHPTPSSDNLQKEDTSLVMLPSGRAVYLEQDSVKKAKVNFVSISEDLASTSTQSAQSVSITDDCVEELNLSASDSNQDVLRPTLSSRISKSGDGPEPDNEVVSQVAYMESDDNSTAMKDMSDISLSTRSTFNNAGPEVLLVPSMDLFSVGCVLLEMFTDGSVAFTLADLLAYRGGDCGRLAKLLERIPCEHIKVSLNRGSFSHRVAPIFYGTVFYCIVFLKSAFVGHNSVGYCLWLTKRKDVQFGC
ncbi:Phosphoinositide 3-kinase regulatory subunit 4 [Paragonimus kellicotti]|nr:Phosphoinositide 3-kinase regulatory subunit 4 [Paragonimus kellicotti]